MKTTNAFISSVILFLTLPGLWYNTAVKAKEKEYVIAAPFAPLYKKIPIDNNGDYLAISYDKLSEYVSVGLRKDDIVIANESCKSPESNNVKQKENWKCVSLRRRTLIFYTQDFPPFSYKGLQEEVAGPGVEIINKVCEDAKLKCPIELKENWGEAQEDVKAEKADGLFFVGKDDRKYLNFGPPLIKTGYSFFVRQDDNWEYRKNRNNLKGKLIGAYGPSATYSSLTSLRDEACEEGISVKIKRYNTSSEVFDALVKKEIHIAYSNLDVGNNLIKKDPKFQGIIVSKINQHKPLDYYIAIRNNIDSSQFYGKLMELIANNSIKTLLINNSMEPAEELTKTVPKNNPPPSGNPPTTESNLQESGWVYKLLIKESGNE